MRLCDWSNFDTECDHLIASVKDGKSSAPPFTFLATSSSPEDQLQCAKLWVAEKCPPSRKPAFRGERYTHDRIRIAYVSADFREHPVSHLTAGMFECHDKSRFDVTAISLGPNDNSEMLQRLKASFEHFIDANTYSDDQLADLVTSSEVDILVDLMGFTLGSRTGVFARRVAPIQLNYLGYLGTMGAGYMDYIIADRVVIPETQYDFYAEKIVYLPNSFQPTDRQRPISDKKFTRAEVGLPQDGFVFCCFNTNYKITPDVYDIWMRILKQVPGSVLWLVAEGPTVERNLRNEAAARGVSGERLIFAQRMPLAEHQARLQLAGLFLDTLPYNAGATATDMLWSGLPVLTRIGDTFVGRMAASLLNAIHVPELIATTPEAYEQMAIDLATHPEKLAAIKNKLAENRLTTPLFDTELFTKHIEAAYSAMHERYQAELSPDHIVIPN
jgi:predicted O-linked N-acetylglucosamine transferase (SPINDLY family)